MVTQEDADTALRDVEATMNRAQRALSYKSAAPHLLIWGTIWALGYGIGAANLVANGLHWPALVAAGAVASIVIGLRESRRRTGSTEWRPLATMGAVAVFITALFTVLPPQTGNQIGTFFPLLVALAYGLIAIWSGGLRIGLVGILVGAASLYAFHFEPARFDLLMAIIGGGGLILGGLWLRRL